METILIKTKKEIFFDSSRNYIRNKVRKFKKTFFDIFETFEAPTIFHVNTIFKK